MAQHISARPSHPLWGAEIRAQRAAIHIRSLDRHLKRWSQVMQDKTGWEVDASGHSRPTSVDDDLPMDVLGRSGIWIGEAVYSLRSALDYLVYNIACVCNNEHHVADTQFPICDHWDDFIAQATGRHPRTGKRKVCRLRHVPKEVIARIGQLQPGADPPCEWTRQLRDLSNLDKHRSMASVRSEANLMRSDHPELTGLVPDARNGQEYYFVVGVYFKDTHDDVVDTLKLLHSHVRALIEEFKPAFQTTAHVVKIEDPGGA